MLSWSLCDSCERLSARGERGGRLLLVLILILTGHPLTERLMGPVESVDGEQQHLGAVALFLGEP